MNERIRPFVEARIGSIAAFLLLLVLAAPVAGVSAQAPTPTTGGEQMYVDPDNRFAVPIPTNWIAEEQDGYVRVATSDEKIAISAAVVEASGATPAIDIVLRMIDPEFDSSVLQQFLATPEADVAETAFYTIDDGAQSGELFQALARKVDDSFFVLVLRGDLETVKLRQVQVDKIFNGILIRTESTASPVASPTA